MNRIKYSIRSFCSRNNTGNHKPERLSTNTIRRLMCVIDMKTKIYLVIEHSSIYLALSSIPAEDYISLSTSLREHIRLIRSILKEQVPHSELYAYKPEELAFQIKSTLLVFSSLCDFDKTIRQMNEAVEGELNDMIREAYDSDDIEGALDLKEKASEQASIESIMKEVLLLRDQWREVLPAEVYQGDPEKREQNEMNELLSVKNYLLKELLH